MDIQDYLKNLFHGVPIEKQLSEIDSILQNDNRFCYKKEVGTFSAEYDNKITESLFHKFNLKPEYWDTNKCDSVFIILNFSKKNNVAIVKSMSLVFDFKFKNLAELEFSKICSKLSEFGISNVEEIDELTSSKHWLFSYVFNNQVNEINISTGKYFQSKNGLYYTEIEIRKDVH